MFQKKLITWLVILKVKNAFLSVCEEVVNPDIYRTFLNKTDIIMGVCYRPLNQDEEVDNTLYRQLD